MARDITVTFADGETAVYRGVPDNATPEQVTQRATSEFKKQVSQLDGGKPTEPPGEVDKLKEVGRVVDKAGRSGLASLPGFIGDTALAVARSPKVLELMGPFGVPTRAAMAIPGVGDAVNATKFGDVTHKLETAGGLLPEVSKPQTEGGKAAGNILESVVSSIAGGGPAQLAQRGLIGLGGGAGGEGLARLFDDNPIARIVGSILGGGGTAAVSAMKPNAEEIITTATKHMTKADWAKAKVLEATLGDEGIPHLKSQLMGPRSTLADTVSIAGTNPQVRPKLVSATEGVQDASRLAFERRANADLPVTMNDQRQVLDDIQGAAEKAIDALKGNANKAYVANMPSDTLRYMPERAQIARQELIDLANSGKFGPTSMGGKALLRFADDLVDPNTGKGLSDPRMLNNLLKDLNSKAMTDEYKGLPQADIKDILRRITPEFAGARDAKKTLMINEVQPVERGLTGDLAQMGGGTRPDKFTAKKTALDLVFPADKPQPQHIIDLSKQIGGEGIGQLLREHLARNMELTTKVKAGSQGTQAPFEFVQAVAGTNAQRQNLEAALQVTAEASGRNPDLVKKNFYKLFQAFESTKDLRLPSSIDASTLAHQAGFNIPGAGVALHSRLGRTLWEKATAKTYNQIADMVLSPTGLAQLEALGKAPPPERVRALALTIMNQSMQAVDKE